MGHEVAVPGGVAVNIPERLNMNEVAWEEGVRAYNAMSEANVRVAYKGTRGLDWEGDSWRHRRAVLGLVIEAAFLIANGHTSPRVNPDGPDGEADFTDPLTGKKVDVKLYNPRHGAYVKVPASDSWLYLWYDEEGHLVCGATGKAINEDGIWPHPSLPFNKEENLLWQM